MKKTPQQRLIERNWGVASQLHGRMNKEFNDIVRCFSPLTSTSKLSSTNKDKLVKSLPTHLPVVVGEYTDFQRQENKPRV